MGAKEESLLTMKSYLIKRNIDSGGVSVCILGGISCICVNSVLNSVMGTKPMTTDGIVLSSVIKPVTIGSMIT